MKVLVTGCDGQLGKELMGMAASFSCDARGVNRQALDITCREAVHRTVRQHAPDAVVNAAAYTAVDKAEKEEKAAYAVNDEAVGYLAEICAELDIPLVHISTDYVFDGCKKGGYTELDSVSPLGVYGKSKLAGEQKVKRLCEKYHILRTSWVFSEHGNNFVKTMLRLGGERKELGIVADQYGKPTSTYEIARVIYTLLNSEHGGWGVYHLAQPEAVSWYQFAGHVFNEARKQGYPLQLEGLKRLGTDDYPTVAKRPANSVLDCSALEKTFSVKLAPWTDSLSSVLKKLKTYNEFV